MKIKTIKKARKLAGKKVLLRVDFNVPIKDGKILDDFKILRQLLTIQYLIDNNCKIIIITHLGRPVPGEKNNGLSVKPIAKKLSGFLFKEVKFINNCFGFKVGTEVSQMKNKDVLMLENLRFESGEKKNSKIFAKELAKLADIYVNDAFGVSHRNHASISAIKNYLPSYAGLLLEKEVIHFEKIFNPEKPLVVIVGGVKLDTKIPLIIKFLKKAHRILIGGAVANNFLAAHGLEVGRSSVDKKNINLVKKIINSPGKAGKNIILPVDAVVGNKSSSWKPEIRKINRIEKKDYIFDIGPETIKLYAKFIKKANTLIWNGPLGMFEEDHFKSGTLAVARLVAARSSGPAYGVVGGGETVEALKLTKMFEYVDWVSTGGGAMLAYLSGKKMPGLSGLIKL